MNFSTHLKRINKTRKDNTTAGYWSLCAAYALNYFFNRPVLVRFTRRDRYQKHKKLLYTVVTGGYDQLNEIPKTLKNWDFICFTDNPDLASKTWQIREIDNKLNLDPFRLSRYYKINNHLVDSEYDLSVYIDCNYRIRGDLDSFVSHILPIDKQIGMLLHPFHSSLHEEVELCIANKKDEKAILRNQYRYYVEDKKFNDPFPHIAGGMIVRRPGDPEVRKLMETWFTQLLKWSRRDQMAFNYSLARHPGVLPHYIPYWILRRYFKKMDHAR